MKTRRAKKSAPAPSRAPRTRSVRRLIAILGRRTWIAADLDVPELVQLLEVYTFALLLSRRPCQIGWIDKRRCWAHAHEHGRAQWCEPCEAEWILKGGEVVP